MVDKDKKKLIALAGIFYIMLYYMFIIFFKTQAPYFTTIQILFETVPLLIAFIVIYKLNMSGDRRSGFLSSLLIIVLSNFIGNCIVLYYNVILKTELSNYIVIDLLSILGAFVFLIALIHKFYRKGDRPSTIILLIDTLTIVCVAVAITWIYNVLPNLLHLTEINLLEIGLEMSYPMVYLWILSVAIILYRSMAKDDKQKQSIAIVILAFGIMYISNVIYIYYLTSDANRIGSIMMPLWMLYDFLIMLAVIEYSDSSKDELDNDEMRIDPNIGLRSILPGFSTIFLLILVNLTFDKLVWICFGLSIILINIRQVVIKLQKKSLILQLEALSKELEEKVEERTREIYEIESSDDLTGLVNRRRFESVVTAMMEECEQDNTEISVILIDLDRFKMINDNYGHSFGDLLVKEFAYILKKLVNEKSVVSRQGGDEFAIVTRGLKDNTYPKELAEKILKKLISPIRLNNQNIYVTCSIGVSMYPRDGESYEDIIRGADLAMYNSKSIGRNTYSFYEEDMIKSNSKRITLERELHKAIEKSEFILHYQPQIDTVDKKVIGLEALIRWNHPKQGIISPFHFIPIAEETGLIGTIGEWVLETACMKMKKWHDMGFDKVKIGVNISAYQFQQENFVEIVSKVLLKTKLEPRYLDLEITENIPMKNEIDVITKLKKLKRLGIQVSMDDFGTGYSSLSYLRRLPIDTLKIPREFIIEIKPYDDKKNIIEAIIAIAQKLELSIIAEGVENEMQLDFLKSKNCNLIQGFFFSKPLAESDVEEFLNKEL